MFLKGYPLGAKTAPKNGNQSVHISWVRLASFCHLGFISNPLIFSKSNNDTHDPKGQENKIYKNFNEMNNGLHFNDVNTRTPIRTLIHYCSKVGSSIQTYRYKCQHTYTPA